MSLEHELIVREPTGVLRPELPPDDQSVLTRDQA